MSQRQIATALMIFGTICVAYGFFMDTTVPCPDYSDDRCLNMFKQAQQTRYLITGGIVLLAGILLYGFRRLKQTVDDEKRERELDESRRRESEQWVEKTVDNTVETTRQVAEKSRSRLRSYFVSNVSDSELGSRLVAGLVVGLWVVAGSYILAGEAVWWGRALSVTFLGCVAYSFRAASTFAVKRHLLWLCAVITLVYFAIATLRVATLRWQLANEWTPDRFEYANFVDMVIAAERVVAVFAVALVISGVALFLAIRADRRERDYH